MSNSLSALLSKALNTYLALDPDSKKRMRVLSGKSAVIELLPFHVRFYCIFEEESVRMELGDHHSADVNISGTPFSLMGMWLSEDKKRFFTEDISIQGNAELGQQILAFFDELEIDWEEVLSHMVGDIPAHQTWCAVTGVSKWTKRACKTMVQNLNEYVHEEAEYVPPREAVRDFFDEVDELRMAVDRLDARIKGLFE